MRVHCSNCRNWTNGGGWVGPGCWLPTETPIGIGKRKQEHLILNANYDCHSFRPSRTRWVLLTLALGALVVSLTLVVL